MSAQNSKNRRWANWKSWPLYVWLLAIYPIVYLFSVNVGRVDASQVGASLILSLIGATLLFLIAYLTIWNPHPAGAMAALVVLAFFTYGHVYNLLSGGEREVVWLLPLYAVLIAAGIALIVWQRRAPHFRAAAPYANLMAAALVVLSLPALVGYYVRGFAASARAAESDSTQSHPRLLDGPTRPDIYYIILDAYSSNAHLLRDYGYDNSPFTDALEQRGFYVAYDSKTPYPITVPSLLGSLNMRYITGEDVQAARTAESDVIYLGSLVADNTVARDLQARGYTYINLMSGYIAPSAIADLNIDFHPGGPVYFAGGSTASYDASRFYQMPFFPVLLETTLARSVAAQAESLPAVADEPLDFRDPERALMAWDEAEKIARMPEATFAVIHIIKPHEPIAFDREGNIVRPYPTWETPDIVDRFFAQLEFTNTRTLALIDSILAHSSTPPIIILQGDHGSHIGSPRTQDGRRIFFEMMNAYYFPGRQCAGLTRDIIPINSFRVLFNCYFDGRYDLLPAHYYLFPQGYGDILHMEEIDMAEWEAARGASEGAQP